MNREPAKHPRTRKVQYQHVGIKIFQSHFLRGRTPPHASPGVCANFRSAWRSPNNSASILASDRIRPSISAAACSGFSRMERRMAKPMIDSVLPPPSFGTTPPAFKEISTDLL